MTAATRTARVTVVVELDGKRAEASTELAATRPTPSTLAVLLTALDAAEGAVAAEVQS